MHYFISDEHISHRNIIQYCNRPFATVDEMNNEIIRRHNDVVGNGDLVIHGGDFTLCTDPKTVCDYIKRLNGKHIFLRGSHDKWMDTVTSIPSNVLHYGKTIWSKVFIEKDFSVYVVVCHYAFRVWNKSHYGSWNLYGHSHSQLPPLGKQHDIGVDNNNFYPISWIRVKEIMSTREDNPNLIKDVKSENKAEDIVDAIEAVE